MSVSPDASFNDPQLDTDIGGATGVADLSTATAATINSIREAFQIQRLLAVVVELCGSAVHAGKSLLIVDVGAGCDESKDDSMFDEGFDEADARGLADSVGGELSDDPRCGQGGVGDRCVDYGS